MQESGRARSREHVLDRLVSFALAAGSAVPLPPAALRLLLARYAAGREDLADALGMSLAAWLDDAVSGQERVGSLAQGLRLALDAEALSTDDRIEAEVARLIQALRNEWNSAPRGVEEAMSGIEVCLLASDRRSPDATEDDLLAPTIDELERVVAASYRPGAGIAHTAGEGGQGSLADHAAAASALLSAYERTGRLPYSMLAEELMRADPSASTVPVTAANFVALCHAASVFCRLAVLHADSGYRDAAVVAADADYARDAHSIAGRLGDVCFEQDLATAAEYGLLLSDWPDLQ